MLQDYLKAGYPALFITTQDIYRAESKLPTECTGRRVLLWDCSVGIRNGQGRQVEEIFDPVEAINYLCSLRDTVLVCHNLHLFLNTDNPEPSLVQAIQNGIRFWKSFGSCLIVIAPYFKLPNELENLFTYLCYPLPDSQELYDLQKDLAPSHVRPNKKAAYSGALGLTEFEAENSYAMSLVKKGYFSTKEVSKQKRQVLRKSGLLELEEPARISEIGGLQNLKNYMVNRAKAITGQNEDLPRPKALLLVGVPGTGKSLACKAVASILNWQMVRLDVGSLKGSLVGESEKKMRQATRIIDSIQNLVVWCDEIEKQFSGANSSTVSDGGSSSGQLAHFLTWLQETTSQIFIIATANNISQLPPEFLRAGRFDATFFVDLPGLQERQHIIRIMNKKYQAEIPLEYAEHLVGYSGAEIEQLARESLFDGVNQAWKSIVPLSRTMKEEIDSLRKWAKTRARIANTPESEDTGQTRKIQPEVKKWQRSS